MAERWKPIPEFEGLYEISDRGNVRSIEKCINNRTYPAKLMKLCRRSGYDMVVLSRNGQKFYKSIGNLVLFTFVGPPPLGSRAVKYIDGNQYNNNLENLKWNVRRSYYMPINQEARQLFYDKAEFYVRKYLKTNRLINTYRLSFIDRDDICNEALLKIWLNIDGYDSSKIEFSRFCFSITKRVLQNLYSKELRKNQHIAPLEIDGTDYIKELSYEMKFYGDS